MDACVRYPLAVVAAYLAADFFAGLYHLLTDRGWNLRQQVAAFEDHHHGAVVFDLKPIYFALPVLLLGLYLQRPFLVAFAVFGGSTELCHYAAHRPECCSRLVRQLQRLRLILPPEVHAQHHGGEHDRSFCVFTGRMNWLVDRLAPWIPDRTR